MSWPTDGKPRYVVVETLGHLHVTIYGGTTEADKDLHRTVAILDRAFCHRCVFKARSEDWKQLGRVRAIAKARRLAEERLAELNTEQVAA